MLIKKLSDNNKNNGASQKLYDVKTPFDTVQVKVISNEFGAEILINVEGKTDTYNNICNCLDSLFLFYDKGDIIENIIEPIIKYLKYGTVKTEEIDKIVKSAIAESQKIKNKKSVKQTKNDNLNNTATESEVKKEYTPQALLDMFKCEDEANLSFIIGNNESVAPIELAIRGTKVQEVRAAAASLSGILMFAESSKYRNPTFGDIERNAMKSVLKLANDGCENPFSKVFSNEKGRYVPAHNNGGNMQGQELLFYDSKKDSIKNRLVTQCLLREKSAQYNLDLLKYLLSLESDENKAIWGAKVYKKGFGSFLDELATDKAESDMVKAVFDKLNKLFPDESQFVHYDVFKQKELKERQSIISSIKRYENKDKDEQIKEFVEYVNTKIKEKRLNGLDDKIKGLKQNSVKDFFGDLKRWKEGADKDARKENEWEESVTFKVFKLFDEPNGYIKLKEIPKIKRKFLNDNNNSNANEEEVDIGEVIERRMNKNFKRLYKSQNQTSTKKDVKKLLDSGEQIG